MWHFGFCLWPLLWTQCLWKSFETEHSENLISTIYSNLTKLSLINHSHLVQRLHFSPWTGILLIWCCVSLCWLSVHASVEPKCSVQSCIPHSFVPQMCWHGVFWAMHFLLSDSVMKTVHAHYQFFGLHGDLGINVAWIVVEGFIQGRGPVKMETHVQAVLWYVLFPDIAWGAPLDSSIEDWGIQLLSTLWFYFSSKKKMMSSVFAAEDAEMNLETQGWQIHGQTGVQSSSSVGWYQILYLKALYMFFFLSHSQGWSCWVKETTHTSEISCALILE